MLSSLQPRHAFACFVALVLCAGCGAGDHSKAASSKADAGKTSAAKRTPSTPPSAKDEPPGCAAIAMSPAEHAAVFELGTTLEAGQETEVCALFESGPNDIWLNSSDLVLSSGSHHGLMWLTSYTELPELDLKHDPIELGKLVDCQAAASSRFSVTQPIAGSQGRFNATKRGVIPADVALKIPSGSYVVLDLHMLNTKPALADVCMKVGLNGVKEEQVKERGGALFFYDPFIAVPSGGRATARMACPIPRDIKLKSAVSHMHKRGVGYEAKWLDGDPFDPTTKTIQMLYQTEAWDEPMDTLWDEPLQLHAGDFIDYHCDYQNPEERDIAQGFDTTDEMCMFVGIYWPAEQGLAFCAHEGQHVDDNGSAGYQIGAGTLDGAAFLSCFWGADYDHGAAEQCGSAECMSNPARYHWQSCFTDACEAIGRYTRPYVDCVSAHGDACDAQMQTRRGRQRRSQLLLQLLTGRLQEHRRHVAKHEVRVRPKAASAGG